MQKEVDDYLHEVAETLRRSVRRQLFDRYALGGPAEVVARLHGMLDEDDVRAGLGQERIDVDVQSSNDDHVSGAAAPVIEEEERRHEREALDRMAVGIACGLRAGDGASELEAGGRGGGPEQTIEALNERRIETLLPATVGRSDAVQHAFDREGGGGPAFGLLTLATNVECPVGGTSLERVPLREAAIEAAIVQDADVVHVSRYPNLGPFEGSVQCCGSSRPGRARP